MGGCGGKNEQDQRLWRGGGEREFKRKKRGVKGI